MRSPPLPDPVSPSPLWPWGSGQACGVLTEQSQAVGSARQLACWGEGGAFQPPQAPQGSPAFLGWVLRGVASPAGGWPEPPHEGWAAGSCTKVAFFEDCLAVVQGTGGWPGPWGEAGVG